MPARAVLRCWRRSSRKGAAGPDAARVVVGLARATRSVEGRTEGATDRSHDLLPLRALVSVDSGLASSVRCFPTVPKPLILEYLISTQ